MGELIICSQPGCRTTAGCQCRWTSLALSPARFLPVNLPFPYPGMFTVAAMDSDGNIIIKTDQISPFADR